MRIFYAVTFQEQKKEDLNAYKEIIANHALKGRFTSQGNYHLTLAFIGDVPQVELETYESVLNSVDTTPITVTGSHIGVFHKKNRDIVWLGIEKNVLLKEVYQTIIKQLESMDVILEKRKYYPHITLGRQVLLDLDFSNFIIPPIELPVRSIALMVSHRVHDQLVYEPIAEVLL